MPNARHELILKLISEQEVNTQEMLRSLLEQNGFHVTQATISRDIRQLGLRKKHNAAGPGYYVRAAVKPMKGNLLADVVIKLDYALNTVVVSCHPGSAQAAGAVLDRMNLEQIVGTIAGDDTIFVLTRSEEQAKALISLLEIRIWG
jgi:transcriptional regulator of arginine metabolism